MVFFKKIEFAPHQFKKKGFKKKLFLLISIFLVFLAFLNVGQDFLHAARNQYQVFLSESILYKTYWVLFIPSFYFLDLWISRSFERKPTIKFWASGILIIGLFTLVHITLVSLLIVMGSYFFLDDSFPFFTPFGYFISESSLLTTFIYLTGASGLLFFEFLKVETPQGKGTSQQVMPLEFLTVSFQNKQYPIPVREILYIQSDRPYISIYTQKGHYLYDSTLIGMLDKLQNPRIVRIHKSTIVNLDQVACYTSRANGDYDVTLRNNQVVRLSRNYYSEFKDHMD